MALHHSYLDGDNFFFLAFIFSLSSMLVDNGVSMETCMCIYVFVLYCTTLVYNTQVATKE